MKFCANCENLKAKLETERMRLAACGAVALADTPNSAKRTRDMHPDYRSAACDDVARRVDECIRLRAQVKQQAEVYAESVDAYAARAKHAEAALREIRDMDYRGNRHRSADIAREALAVVERTPDDA